MNKIRIVYLPDLFEGRGEKGQFDLVFVERLWIIRLMVVTVMSYSGVGLHILNFLHSSLPVIQQEIFKNIVLVVDT